MTFPGRTESNYDKVWRLEWKYTNPQQPVRKWNFHMSRDTLDDVIEAMVILMKDFPEVHWRAYNRDTKEVIPGEVL